MKNNFIEQLISAIGQDNVITGAAMATRSVGLYAPDLSAALALLTPQKTADLSAILTLCHEYRQPLVPYGGGTGLVDGTKLLSNEVVLSLEKFNRIEAIDPIGRTMTVQAGVTLQEAQKAASVQGMLLPLDLAARGSATIGGNIATNAGGIRVLRYGMMRHIVLGLEAVLADGTVVSSMNKLLKNNAGYDLKQLFIGSEGTLGVVTRVVLRLFPRPTSRQTVLLSLNRYAQVPQLLQSAMNQLGGALSSFELMWGDYYDMMTAPPVGFRPPLARKRPFYVIIESMGNHPERDALQFGDFLEAAHEAGLFEDAAVAEMAVQRADIWKIREDTEWGGRIYPNSNWFDVSLPLAAMGDYVAELRRKTAALPGKTALLVYGHAADGNLHITLHAPAADAAVAKALVYEPLQALGGSISAEHGIGLHKKAHLHLSRSLAEIQMMRTIKKALDPHNILNPGKIFD